jgi:hypothetical protein
MLKTKAGEVLGTRMTKAERIIGDRVVISVPEAAEILEMSRDAAYRAAKRGDLPTFEVGSLIKVPVSGLYRMLAGK